MVNNDGSDSADIIGSTSKIKPILEPKNILRPEETIRYLHDTLLPHSSPCQNLTTFLYTSEVDPEIYLITSGSLRVYRAHDSLRIVTTKGPVVAGLQEMFNPFNRHYFKISVNAKVSTIRADKAKEIFTQKNLWQEVAEVFAYYMRVMVYRDEHLVTSSAYKIIRAKLIEYNEMKNWLIEQNIGVVAFILESTTLSRSSVYYVIRALTHGGYISMRGGKLLEIKKLPNEF